MKRYQRKFDESGNYVDSMTILLVDIDNISVAIYFYEDSILELLTEAKQKGIIKISGNYSATKHKPHTPQGDYHIHIYDKNKQIGAINKSGTTHDSYHGAQLPISLVGKLKSIFSDYKIPDNGFLENASVINPKLKLWESL